MKLARTIASIYLYAMAGFFVLMSLDVFAIEGYTFWELLGGFLMSILPGIILALVVYFLRKYPLWLGLIVLAANLYFLFFFHMASDVFLMLVMFVPMTMASAIFVGAHFSAKS